MCSCIKIIIRVSEVQYTRINLILYTLNLPVMILMGCFTGPGQYNIFNIGMAQESLKKAYLESTRHGPFGTTSARIMPIIQKHEVSLPGPSHYQVSSDNITFNWNYQSTFYLKCVITWFPQPKQNEERYKKQLTSTFASLTDRLSAPAAQVRNILNWKLS